MPYSTSNLDALPENVKKAPVVIKLPKVAGMLRYGIEMLLETNLYQTEENMEVLKR